MKFHVTRVTYQTMHLHPKRSFQPCPSNTSVLIVSPDLHTKKTAMWRFFPILIPSTTKAPALKIGSVRKIRVNAPLVRTPARTGVKFKRAANHRIFKSNPIKYSTIHSAATAAAGQVSTKFAFERDQFI